MDSNTVKKAPRQKTYRGTENMKGRFQSFAAAKGQAPAGKTLHSGQPQKLSGMGFKNGHTATNTGKH